MAGLQRIRPVQVGDGPRHPQGAMQGCFAAYAPTAQMYEDGKGTMADPGKAYMWYNIAVSYLPQGKERREMIERREKRIVKPLSGETELLDA